MSIKAGIVTDTRYLEHKTGHIHPDHPNRLRAVYKMLETNFPSDLIKIEASPTSLEYLEYVHTPIYIEKVLKTADHRFTSLAHDTPASSMTYLAAWLAVGGCLNGLDALVSGKCHVCFSLIRPPGHHAMPDRAGGFCIFNNLGITARYAINHYGFKRILIIDWDIHHGNGLQNIFYKENKVLYFSSHDTLLYPYTGDWEETGSDKGLGYTVNLPVPRKLDDQEFFYIYKKILGPMVKQFKPDLILVSAGFDGHYKDPIGRSKLTENVFGWLTQFLINLSQDYGSPPVLLALEGGYHSRSLADSVKQVLKAMLQKNKESIEYKQSEQAKQLVKKIKKIHSKYGIWVK